MSTNMTGFRWFSKIFAPCALDESSLGGIERVNPCIHQTASLLEFYCLEKTGAAHYID